MSKLKFQLWQRVRVKPLDCTMDKKDWQEGVVVNFTAHSPTLYVVACDCGLYATEIEGTVFNESELEAI